MASRRGLTFLASAFRRRDQRALSDVDRERVDHRQAPVATLVHRRPITMPETASIRQAAQLMADKQRLTCCSRPRAARSWRSSPTRSPDPRPRRGAEPGVCGRRRGLLTGGHGSERGDAGRGDGAHARTRDPSHPGGGRGRWTDRRRDRRGSRDVQASATCPATRNTASSPPRPARSRPTTLLASGGIFARRCPCAARSGTSRRDRFPPS